MLDLEAIHQKSRFHKTVLAASPLCGCFSCLRIFPPNEIREWARSEANDAEKTCAICPYCSVDAVLPSTEVELTAELLTAMQSHWFAYPHCSAIVTFEEANSAKAILEKRLGRPPWLSEIRICKDATGLHTVKVELSNDTGELWDVIPQTIDGVRVIVDVVGREALVRKRFFQEMQAGYAQMTPPEMAEDAEELALWENATLRLKPSTKE